jgi:hypothetical protein
VLQRLERQRPGRTIAARKINVVTGPGKGPDVTEDFVVAEGSHSLKV